MAPGTSSFDDLLRNLDAAVLQLEPAAAMEAIAAAVRDACGARLWFAEIFGPRWSHVAGLQEGASASGELRKIPIAPDLGVVVASFGDMTAPRQEVFLSWIQIQAARWTGR